MSGPSLDVAQASPYTPAHPQRTKTTLVTFPFFLSCRARLVALCPPHTSLRSTHTHTIQEARGSAETAVAARHPSTRIPPSPLPVSTAHAGVRRAQMDAFQTALDELQRESREQITQVQEAASTAVLRAHVVPHRIAVAMAQRFTPDRIQTSFPVLCLLDATLVRTAAAAAASPTPGEADQALAAVLGEFWTLDPATAFAAVHEYGVRQPAWGEKCLRLVRRWKQRKLLPEPLMTTLVTAMEKGATAATAAAAPGAAPGTSQEAAVATSLPPSAAPAASSASVNNATRPAAGASSPSSSRVLAGAPPPAFTAAQVRAFQATLQACMSALESLPAQRAALYVELVRSQHFRGPSRMASTFFEDLLKELRREVTMVSSTANNASASAASAGAGAAAKDGADAASSGHAREALGKLLDQLHTSAADGGPGGSGAGGTGGAGGASGAAGPGAQHSAATVVVRYVSPIFSDIYAKQPLGQRGAGFGTLLRRAGQVAGGGGGGASSAFYATYYPKPEANVLRPFRIPPARQMHGGAVRLPLPRPQEWVAAQDMAELTQYMSRGGPERDRKRGRDGF